jgi:hypothetical protein
MGSTADASREPPLGFCKARFSPLTGGLCYYFDGAPLLSTSLAEDQRPRFRMISDGNLQSRPLVQQIFLALERGRETEITFFLGPDAVNMKPSRARNGEPILGQVGCPLLYGVNGLYDVGRDILIAWEGANWRWRDDRLLDAVYVPGLDRVEIAAPGLAPGAEGPDRPGCVRGRAARLSVELCSRPWTVRVLMRYYRDHLGYSYHMPWKRRPDCAPVTGWCSWEAYGREVDAKKLLKAVGFLKENLAPYGLEYVQVDDGYQGEPVPPRADGGLRDSWLVPNARFPGGHADILDPITKAGFTPGIWTSASITNGDFAGRDGNGLIGADGRPVEADWIHFVPSCGEEFLKGQVVPLYRGLREKGYRYFKADTLRHLLYEGLIGAAEAGLVTNDEAEARFRRYIESIREGIGPSAFLLACWGVLSEAVGLCDACRIATDARTSWGSFVMQVYETARWFHAQRILFQVDPDHVCARSHLPWARSLLSLVSLSGGLFMLSDGVNAYDAERLDVIRRTIPAQPVMTAETGPVRFDKPAFAYTPGAQRTAGDVTVKESLDVSAADMEDLQGHAFGTLWSVHYLAGERRWCVLGRFALVRLEEGDLQLGALGLDPQKGYHAFDFWAEEYLGCVRGVLHCPPVPLGECQVIGLAAGSDRPACVADNRHISMGLQFIASERWEGGTLSLGVRGVAGREFSCWISIPDGSTPRGVRGTGVTARWADDGSAAPVRRLAVAFQADEGRLEMDFS